MLDVARKGKFRIADCDEAYEGYTFDNHWNGWEMPLFEKAVVNEFMLSWLDEIEHLACSYSKKTDTFKIKDLCLKSIDEITGLDIQTEDGKTVHVYDFGSLGWIWEEAR